ncbi:MAG: Cof-type HAD-IIB family hydrolase [Thermaerobacter sp.]|nr:Cof-type HAD-IIB family hydrolase [Thermaerobacter sp.]
MNFRLVALDVDGTLTDSRGEIPARVRQAVGRTASRGVSVTLATGRRLRLALPVARELGLTAPLVTSGGPLVVEQTGRVLYREPLSEEQLRRAVAFLRRRGLPPVAAAGRGQPPDVFYEEEGHPAQRFFLERNDGFTRRVADLTAGEVPDPVRVFCLGEREAVHRAWRELSDGAFRLVLNDDPQGGTAALEIYAPGASKASGVRALAAHLGVAREEILAVGNQLNDLELIEFAGWGVAVGNAVAELKERAAEVTASSDEAGVAVVLEKYLLGGG